MGYYLGVDLGTTYTAAAVWREGRVEIANLGNRAPVIPSVVFLKEDESVLTGEAANRRGVTQPGRVAREFKRRIGDTTPIFLGGSPYSADALTAKLLRWVVDAVSAVEGSAPDGIAVAHPANWGPFKLDLLRQAVERADLDDVTILSEPEAAAIHYASQSRVEPGSVIAVFDLGGGTFDAAVLHKTEAGFELLGAPRGIERLGGIDFDEAVFQHVLATIGTSTSGLDHDDAATVAAVARLRQDCVEAKEALSSDTDVAIPVWLPHVQTEIRLTRVELEHMIRPALADTITALQRALRSAGVAADEVTAVLLVGGSSRIPLVAELVGGQLGRPSRSTPTPSTESRWVLPSPRRSGLGPGRPSRPSSPTSWRRMRPRPRPRSWSRPQWCRPRWCWPQPSRTPPSRRRPRRPRRLNRSGRAGRRGSSRWQPCRWPRSPPPAGREVCSSVQWWPRPSRRPWLSCWSTAGTPAGCRPVRPQCHRGPSHRRPRSRPPQKAPRAPKD